MNLLDIILRGTASTSVFLRWQPHLLAALALWIASGVSVGAGRYLQVFALSGVEGPPALAAIAALAAPLAWTAAGVAAYAASVCVLTRRSPKPALTWES